MAGPLIVFSTPFCVSTTPGIFAMASPTRGPELVQQRLVVGEQLDLDRLRRVGEIADHVLQYLGELDIQLRLSRLDLLRGRRPSPRRCARSRSVFRWTVKSPVFASVTAARPICRPVRREVISTSGVLLQNLFHVLEHAVGFGQRTARGHDVIQDKAAFIHLRQQVGAQALDSRNTSASDQHQHRPPTSSERPRQ